MQLLEVHNRMFEPCSWEDDHLQGLLHMWNGTHPDYIFFGVWPSIRRRIMTTRASICRNAF